MPTDEQALLAAIRDRPEDDTPRLVFADYLDDHAKAGGQCGACDGHGLVDVFGRGASEGFACESCRGFGGRRSNGYAERAEFIRVQVERARPTCQECGGRDQKVGPCGLTDYYRDCYACKALKARERALFAPAADWFPGDLGGAVVVLPGGRHSPADYPLAVVRRGFVDEWAGPLGAWVGGDCGRVVGIGPAVAAAHPVTTVAPSDREPGQYGNTHEWYWTEWTPDVTYPRSTLPPGLFDRLAGVTHTNQLGTRSKHYPTRDAAMLALSAALLAHARRPPA